MSSLSSSSSLSSLGLLGLCRLSLLSSFSLLGLFGSLSLLGLLSSHLRFAIHGSLITVGELRLTELRLASALLASSVKTTSNLAPFEKAVRALKLNWESSVLGEIATAWHINPQTLNAAT